LTISFRLLVEDQATASKEDWVARYAEWTNGKAK
jgi:hypothetical protein